MQALDLLFQKMQAAGFPFGRVVAMSGCGQQHGSVYWKEGSENVLKNLDSQLSLEGSLKVEGNDFDKIYNRFTNLILTKIIEKI